MTGSDTMLDRVRGPHMLERSGAAVDGRPLAPLEESGLHARDAKRFRNLPPGDGNIVL